MSQLCLTFLKSEYFIFYIEKSENKKKEENILKVDFFWLLLETQCRTNEVCFFYWLVYEKKMV